MGGSLKDKVRRDQLEAMKTVMVGDRIRNRAKTCEVYAFDEMTRGHGNDANRNENFGKHLRKVFEIAARL
jgi:NAD(P)H dehydrogenase (quinone)